MKVAVDIHVATQHNEMKRMSARTRRRRAR
jgi:hypothetical protein